MGITHAFSAKASGRWGGIRTQGPICGTHSEWWLRICSPACFFSKAEASMYLLINSCAHPLRQSEFVSGVEEMTMNEPSITVLSSFDWSVPGTPELICGASHAGLAYHYFSNQPQFSNKSQQIGHAPKIPLYEIDSVFRIKVSPIKNTLQNSRITCSSSNKEIMLSKLWRIPLCSIRIWSPLEAFSRNWKRPLAKLCISAWLQRSWKDFIMNPHQATKSFIPKSMVEEVRKICGEKTEAFPQLVSSFQPRSVLSGRVQQFLKEIPKDRLLRRNRRRIDMELFSSAMKELKFCSSFRFIPFFEKDENFFKLPYWEIGNFSSPREFSGWMHALWC